jgi:hypothetical protein
MKEDISPSFVSVSAMFYFFDGNKVNKSIGSNN